MPTAKQVNANRRNSQLATGPRTPEGKAAVRLNAIKHGLLSNQSLLPNEDSSLLAEVGERLREQLQPVGPLEELLVDRIVSAAWRLQRLAQVEVGIFEMERFDCFGEDKGPGLAFIQDGNGADAFSKLSRYEAAIERSLYRALHELQMLQSRRDGQFLLPPFVMDANASGELPVPTQ